MNRRCGQLATPTTNGRHRLSGTYDLARHPPSVSRPISDCRALVGNRAYLELAVAYKEEGAPVAVGASGTFLGLPAPSAGTNVKQLKDHSRRSATISHSSRRSPRLLVSSGTSTQRESVGPHPASPALVAPATLTTLTRFDLPDKAPDIPSERASNERHERHFSVKISPVTPTPHIMRTRKTAGQEPFPAGSRIATHST